MEDFPPLKPRFSRKWRFADNRHPTGEKISPAQLCRIFRNFVHRLWNVSEENLCNRGGCEPTRETITARQAPETGALRQADTYPVMVSAQASGRPGNRPVWLSCGL